MHRPGLDAPPLSGLIDTGLTAVTRDRRTRVPQPHQRHPCFEPYLRSCDMSTVPNRREAAAPPTTGGLPCSTRQHPPPRGCTTHSSNVTPVVSPPWPTSRDGAVTPSSPTVSQR